MKKNSGKHISIDTVDHAIPDSFADPEVLNFDAYGKNEAKEIITSVSNNSNICKLAITFKQKKLNIDEFDSLLSIIKFDSTLVSFIQFLKDLILNLNY